MNILEQLESLEKQTNALNELISNTKGEKAIAEASKEIKTQLNSLIETYNSLAEVDTDAEELSQEIEERGEKAFNQYDDTIKAIHTFATSALKNFNAEDIVTQYNEIKKMIAADKKREQEREFQAIAKSFNELRQTPEFQNRVAEITGLPMFFINPQGTPIQFATVTGDSITPTLNKGGEGNTEELQQEKSTSNRP